MKKSYARYSWGLGDSGLEWMDKMKRGSQRWDKCLAVLQECTAV